LRRTTMYASGDRFKPVPLRLACGAFYAADILGSFFDFFYEFVIPVIRRRRAERLSTALNK